MDILLEPISFALAGILALLLVANAVLWTWFEAKHLKIGTNMPKRHRKKPSGV